MNYFCFEASRQEKVAKNNLKLFGTFLTSQSYNQMMFNSLIFKSLIMMAFFSSKTITIIFFLSQNFSRKTWKQKLEC